MVSVILLSFFLLAPKFQNTSSDISLHASRVVRSIHEMGGCVVAFITDNARMNINMYRDLGFEEFNYYKEHPFDSNRLIFQFYDPVHILKNLRNNFINKKDPEQTVQYFIKNDSGELILQKAKFIHLYLLYREKANNPLKISSKLTLKSLIPSSMERQKVSLALKIFCPENVIGLKYLAEKINDPSILQTAFLIDKFTKWFTYFNTKTPDKGINRNDPHLNPISSTNNITLDFFKSFIEWLDIQTPLKSKFLTKQTSGALRVSSVSLVNCSVYLISKGFYGILTGNFQSDPIEARFGLYRLANGSNYHIAEKAAKYAEKN